MTKDLRAAAEGAIAPAPATAYDHPDLMGGIAWSESELRWIARRDAAWRTALAQPPSAEAQRLEALAERLKIEAQIHAQEAQTANATIAEIYQVVTGSTGEPGNWSGAEPVRKRIAALEAENAGLRKWIFDRLNEIHNLAHIKSSGPAEIDGYWEIRSLAEDALKDTP